MGYYQSADWNLQLTKDAEQKIIAWFSDSNATKCEIMDDVVDAIDEVFSESSVSLAYIDGKLSGGTYGKSYDDGDRILIALAEAGARGYVDFLGEDDAQWRVRMRDGDIQQYRGVVTYPGDPYGNEV